MDTLKHTNRTVERLAKTGADSYKMVVDHVVAQQERNVRFAQEVLDDTARELGIRPRATGASSGSLSRGPRRSARPTGRWLASGSRPTRTCCTRR